MKKIVSIMLVCLFLFTGVLATAFAVSADENVDFTDADFENFMSILVTSLQNVANKDTRAARFNWYLDTIGKRDSEIDARIDELFSGSAIADTMLNDLLGGGMEKEQIRLILEVLKSLPEEERAAAVDEFYSNQDNGAYYAFADPDSEEYDEDLAASYKGIYDHYINAEFQATVLADYGLEYIDFVPFMRVITNHIQFTKDSLGRLCPLEVSDTFADNILANVTSDSINGIELVDKYTVLDILLGKFSDETTEENLDDFIGVFKGEDAYAIIGDFNDDGRITSLDGTWMLRWIAEWEEVVEEIPVDSARYNSGAMVKPDDNGLTTGDVLKLLKYTSQWDGIILGRATENSYK